MRVAAGSSGHMACVKLTQLGALDAFGQGCKYETMLRLTNAAELGVLHRLAEHERGTKLLGLACF